MTLCDWWSRLNRFRNLDGFHPFILISSLTIAEHLEPKGGLVSLPTSDVQVTGKAPLSWATSTVTKGQVSESLDSYHMMTSGRHGNVMWHIDTGEDAGGLSFHLFPSLMKMKRETFRNQSDI